VTNAGSDMTALREVFDTNHNGSTAMTRWSAFRIWRDRNQDGVSQASELVSLDQAGIRSIDLKFHRQPHPTRGGSTITGTSTYTRTDGKRPEQMPARPVS